MSHNPARPKRPADDYARTQYGSDIPDGPSKKPRFDVRNPSALAPDALEEDAILDADVIGGRGQQVKRNAVNIDGYESDSDEDNFDLRADLRERETKKQNQTEDQDDMFADLEEGFKDGDDSEGEAGRRGGNKKAVRFLNEDEIEGQVKNSKSGGHVSADFTIDGRANGKGKAKAGQDNEVESSSDSEVDDETRASAADVDAELGAGSKKTHAPKLDAFNMRNEQEEGAFDESGNFVRKAADPDAVHDVWMEGVSKKEMRKAKEAAERRDEERRKRTLEDDAKPTGDVLKVLIPLLDRGETILEALARLGKGRRKDPKWQNKNKNKKKQSAVAENMAMGGEVPAEIKRRETVETITEAADLLLTRGQPEIYDAERELLVRQYQRETGEDYVELVEDKSQSDDPTLDASTSMWEYRWADARDGGEIHGPYDSATMQAWNGAGYFGEGVEFRRQDKSEWSRLAEFF